MIIIIIINIIIFRLKLLKIRILQNVSKDEYLRLNSLSIFECLKLIWQTCLIGLNWYHYQESRRLGWEVQTTTSLFLSEFIN